MNTVQRHTSFLTSLTAVLLSSFLAACGGGGGGNDGDGTTPDTTAPRVTSTVPADDATGVAINTQVTATFSEDMDPATISATTFTLAGPGPTAITGTVAYTAGSRTATFTPTAPALSISTLFTGTVTTGARDAAGNALASDFVWEFTTGTSANFAGPTVTLTNPADLATGVATNSAVDATFSEAMDPATITIATFTLQESGLPPGPALGGIVTYNALTDVATFEPALDLLDNTSYTATVTNGAENLAGNALVSGLIPNPWTFTTGAAVIPPLAIDLGLAETFGLASRAGLTTTGVTVINGDVALHPLGACTDATGNAGASQSCLVAVYASPTGMTVNGTIYWPTDAETGVTALQVTTDLNEAWVAGMAMADTAGAIAADEIGGNTFTPGVYHNATLGMMANSTATLDAQGDADAVFVFKVDSSFVDSGTLLQPTEILLINGAQARNVWFVAGLDVTIGSGTTWNGNILAGRDVTVNDGSTVTGRVLAGASGAGALVLTGAASPSLTTISVP